jgi:septal ring factor EnvC (AmiA/AmiB activator)
MKSQLDTLVEFLSGREGEETDRLRLELADPESDATRFLNAAQRLSGDLFTPHFLKRLGLPPRTRGHVPDVGRPQSPPSMGRRLFRLLPWLTTALASGAVLWLVLTCRCHPPKPSPAKGVPDKENLRQQIADLKARLDGERVAGAKLRGHLAEQPNKLREAEAENDRLRQQVAVLERALRAEQKEKETRQVETVGLRAQMEQLGRERDKARGELKALRAEVQKQRQEVKDLSAKQQEQQKVNGELRQKLLRAKMSAAELSAARDRIRELENALAKEEATAAELAEARNMIQKLERRLTRARNRSRELENGLTKAKATASALAQARARIRELENGLAKVRAELVTLRGTVSRLRLPDKPQRQLLRDLNKLVSRLP